MIRVTLSFLVCIYLFAFLSLVFGAWLRSEWIRSRREKAAYRHRFRCTLCSAEFEDDTAAVLPRCPRCGCLNERDRFHPI